MDILAHSLWSIALIPGDQIAAKVVLGLTPDLAVFGPQLLLMIFKKKSRPKFKDREQMMEWFDRKDNRWVKTLYRWTHSLVIWTVLIIPAFILFSKSGSPPPWFLLGAPLHIILDIPTHTKKSFPVQFLTPFSRLQINGFHWSGRNMLILNYSLIAIAILLRYVIL
ncbi:hypothetical protein ACFLYK_03345 [Candidatus Cloacimonadota bacterium]